MAKFIALAITLAIALLIMFAAGFVLTFLQSLVYGIPMASPLRANGMQDLVAWLVVGFPVLPAACRDRLCSRGDLSKPAGRCGRGHRALPGRVGPDDDPDPPVRHLRPGQRPGNGLDSGIQPVGPEWFQFLPLTIGGDVLGALPGGGGLNSTDLTSDILKPVPFSHRGRLRRSCTWSWRWQSR